MATTQIDRMASPHPDSIIIQESLSIAIGTVSDPSTQVQEKIMFTEVTETTVGLHPKCTVQVQGESIVSNITKLRPAKVKKEKKDQKPQPSKTSSLPFYQSLGRMLWQQSRGVAVRRFSMVESPSVAERQARVGKDSRSLGVPDAVASSSRHRHLRTLSNNEDGGVSDHSISTGSLSDIQPKDPATSSLKGGLYNLEDFYRLEAINQLIADYSSVSHMSVRDPSYSFWLNGTRTAAVHFKLLNKVAVLAGDPLCAPSAMPSVLEEFEQYCRRNRWKMSVIGASEYMLEIAKLRKWPAMRFGTEKVLNPMTNEVLLGKSGKRTTAQCRQLLDPTKGGLSLGIYVPSNGRELDLEAELTRIYNEWRDSRNTSRDNQAFITVFDMFAMPHLMTFIYSTDSRGCINGFAALRRMGSSETGRFHIDPFIQSSSAPRGTSDLLVFASLAYLHELGATYLGLGHEPVSEPDSIWNMNSMIVSATRRVYRHIFGRLPVGGKETFNSRWKPDTEQEAGLYLIFVGRKTPSPKHLLAMTHFANISLRNVLKADWKDLKQELHVPVASPELMLYAGTTLPVSPPAVSDHRQTEQ
ncbi:hypothetical protein PV08_11702 [Exophiala spinifera]|uniref:Phosphatidylglycerol lysyltransferase C-terminal domain-containing protein n=1 Tax=Exophiala spinifera TaxID=91928 RepID=A0A0D1Y4S1_9EURO|nr:uncharacterized protein PV08_11702 [Exophiala spinifera]KIW09926.1 hypothetical protein PV08_11702 [Exophiala spinifera]